MEQTLLCGDCDWPGRVWVRVKFVCLMAQTLPYDDGWG